LKYNGFGILATYQSACGYFIGYLIEALPGTQTTRQGT